MKLTKRQRIILWIGGGILFLAIFITTAVIIGVNLNKTPTSSTPTPLPSPQPTPLEIQRSQAITEIQTALSNQSISETDLVQKLIAEHKLQPDQTDWKVLLENSSLNTAEKITNLINELQTILTELKSKSPDPLPIPPSPQYTPPTPTPDIRPSDKWGGILWDIKKFIESNPKSLQEIKDWIEEQNIPDPLEGVDLAGASIEQLRSLNQGGEVPELGGSKKGGEEYKDFIQLSASGDGNCFLNSYSVLLTGRERDTSLALPLRVKMCLELMTKHENFFPYEKNEASTLNSINSKIINENIAISGRWLDNWHIEILSFILKRPLAVISRLTDEQVKNWKNWNDRFYFNQFPEDNKVTQGFKAVQKYDERWVVYNSGGHFQPLIPPPN